MVFILYATGSCLPSASCIFIRNVASPSLNFPFFISCDHRCERRCEGRGDRGRYKGGGKEREWRREKEREEGTREGIETEEGRRREGKEKVRKGPGVVEQKQ